jgi:hypothetical protein
MPTATIQVAAVTSPDQWSLGAGANKVVAVNGPDDDDASYIYTTYTNYYQQYSLAAHSIPSGSAINSISIYSRCKKVSGSAAWYTYLWLGAASATYGPHTMQLTYTNFTDLTPRPGGGAWAFSDLASLEVSIRHVASGNGYCTSLWLIVDYTPPAAGNMLLMFR